jgi:hypothetical protein
MKTTAKYTTDILRFVPEEMRWKKFRDYEIVQNLRFMNREFYLLYKDGVYFVGTNKGNDIASVYLKKEKDGDYKYYPGEIAAIFRKEYMKNGITSEMLDLFLEDPQEYKKKYKK